MAFRFQSRPTTHQLCGATGRGGTNALWPLSARYIESWNLCATHLEWALCQPGLVGDFIRPATNGVSPYNSSPLPSSSTPCMAMTMEHHTYRLTGPCTRLMLHRRQPNHQPADLHRKRLVTCTTSAGLYNTAAYHERAIFSRTTSCRRQ